MFLIKDVLNSLFLSIKLRTPLSDYAALEGSESVMLLGIAALLFVLGLFASTPAVAADQAPLSDAQLAQRECSACHYFYPRQLLPAYSWKAILDNLDNHFGENAALDKDSRKRIQDYLAAGRSTEIPIRVTELDWWKMLHEVGLKQLAARNNIRLSNCGACHR